MPKPKAIFVCQNCGAGHPRWLGRCPSCQTWDSLVEEQVAAGPPALNIASAARLTPLTQARGQSEQRSPTGIAELNRVLGGGLVPGMVVLVGGEPGIGKSTLMLQLAASLVQAGGQVLYVAAEESARQVGLRAECLGLGGSPIMLQAETNLEAVLADCAQGRFSAVIADSIQALRAEELGSAAGGLGQVCDCAWRLAAQVK